MESLIGKLRNECRKRKRFDTLLEAEVLIEHRPACGRRTAGVVWSQGLRLRFQDMKGR